MWEFADTMVGDSCGRASCFERCTTFTEIPGKLKESEQEPALVIIYGAP